MNGKARIGRSLPFIGKYPKVGFLIINNRSNQYKNKKAEGDLLLCHYCGKNYPNGLEVRWGNNHYVNYYCTKCLPEVESNMNGSYLYKGHTVKTVEQ
jgi:hypothetical protein